MAGWDTYWTAQQADIRFRKMRARLQARIAEQDAIRGRPLTDRERIENLFGAVRDETGCNGSSGAD